MERLVTLTNDSLRSKGSHRLSICNNAKGNGGYALHNLISSFVAKPRSVKHFLINSVLAYQMIFF